jgi:hypothetical protein
MNENMKKADEITIDNQEVEAQSIEPRYCPICGQWVHDIAFASIDGVDKLFWNSDSGDGWVEEESDVDPEPCVPCTRQLIKEEADLSYSDLRWAAYLTSARLYEVGVDFLNDD